MALFEATFTASEGAAEGRLIAGFVTELLATTPEQDLICWSAYQDQTLVGCIVFSRLVYDEDPRNVFILSPVAVKPDRQGTGIGQRLITHGLADLRSRAIDLVITYGDPTFYAKTGFRHIAENFASPPLALSHPDGWLACALSGTALDPLHGPSRCVPALNNPALW